MSYHPQGAPDRTINGGDGNQSPYPLGGRSSGRFGASRPIPR